MSGKANYVAEGFHNVTPYLCVSDAARAIEFYKEAFGATEIMRMEAPDGKIGHAEVRIGDSIVMIADEFPELSFRSPQSVGVSAHFMLYDEDVDARVERAIAAGAKLTRPVADQFYGDRTGSVEDPFGHHWYIATHLEDLSPEEVKRRGDAELAKHAQEGAGAQA
ncbi:MAG TPA: VOC family protein [Pyrinomonadaceae bacterium]|nr:VOC family protein [Pyrinomonadaceae bacterium]